MYYLFLDRIVLISNQAKTNKNILNLTLPVGGASVYLSTYHFECIF